jgi:LL-diaminopimelate aminotransferase
MFVWAAIPEHYKSSEKFTMDLLERAGVLVTPGSAFGPSGEGYVRMALVQDKAILQEAVGAVEKSGILEA